MKKMTITLFAISVLCFTQNTFADEKNLQEILNENISTTSIMYASTNRSRAQIQAQIDKVRQNIAKMKQYRASAKPSSQMQYNRMIADAEKDLQLLERDLRNATH